MTRQVPLTNAMRLAILDRDKLLQKQQDDSVRMVAGAKEQFAKDDGKIDRLTKELTEASRELSERDARLAAAEKDLKAAEARNEELQQQIAAARQTAEGAGRKAAKSERANAEAAARVHELEAQVAQLQSELTATIARAEAEKRATATVNGSGDQASQEKIAELEHDLAATQRLLEQALANLRKKNQELAAARKEAARIPGLEAKIEKGKALHAEDKKRWRDAHVPLRQLNKIAGLTAKSAGDAQASEQPEPEPAEAA
jgi:chromosome segregation ATPase